jgi:PAS domain S-box-containing protein
MGLIFHRRKWAMRTEERAVRTGIDVVGNVAWGSHLCLLYRSAAELIELLVPYFKTGLTDHEFCLWITAEPLPQRAAAEALRKSIPNLNKYLENGQLEIIPHTEWYIRDGRLDLRRVAADWQDKMNYALGRGFEGVRGAFNIAWLEAKDWPRFIKFERKDTDNISRKLTICTYSLAHLEAPEIMDAANSHQITIVRRPGRWDAIEQREPDNIEHILDKRVRELRCLYDIASITGTARLTLSQRFLEIAKALPRAFQHADSAFARITYHGEEFKSDNYEDTERKISADIMVQGTKAGAVEVGYIGTVPEQNNGLFSKEERLLLDAVAERLGVTTEHRDAEQRIEEERDRTQRYLDLAGVIFLAIDTRGCVTSINRKGCQVLGYKEKEVIGRNWFDNFIPERFKHKVKQISLKLLAGVEKGTEFCENPVLTKNGEERTIAWHNRTLRDDDGNITGHFSSGEDITDQRQSQELLRTISDSSPLGIYILQDDKLQYTNSQLQKITGYSQQELTGRELLSLVSLEDSDVVKSSTVFTLQEQSPYPSEYRILNKNGQIKWVMQTVSPIHYLGREAILGNLMDITERKYLERKIIEYEELSKMKSDLLATVSHELRTPLATIKGYSTLILDYYSRLNPDETKDYLKSIDTSTDRLAKLVDNLLDTSRMEAGLLKLEKTLNSITQLIKGVAAEASFRADQYRIVPAFSRRLPKVNIDAKRIRQVLDNLIDNAVKYSPPGSEIAISAEKSGNELLISVTDQGPGIPPEELTNVFERMYRIEQRLYSGADGIGLGLYICQKLVESHGGRIWAESTPGKGSTFKLTLPLTDKITERKRSTRRAA